MPRRNTGPRLRFLEKRQCFYVVWTEGGRSRERSTGTANREQAEVALGEFIAARTKRSGPRDLAETLVTDVLAAYGEAKADTPAAARIGAAIAVLVPFWSGRTVADIHEDSCRKYGKARGRSAGTIRRELTVLRAAVNYAVRSNRLTRTASFWLPEPPEARDVWLTRAEFARLLRAARNAPKAGEHLPLFLLIAIYSGRRKEAILGLRWANVDLAQGTIDFRRTGQAETKKKRGVVRIHRKLLGHLRRAKARQHAADLDFVLQWNGRRVGDIKKAFGAAVDHAALGKHVTPHTLKHTAATWLMQGGASLWDASVFLGTSMQTLEKVYAHHSPDSHERALKALGGAVRRMSA
jgi:integrase